MDVRRVLTARVRWQDQAWGERLLRAWLGGTFLYAGVEKLADPGFLDEGSPTFIGSQLEGFAQGSPIAPLLDLAAETPVAAGITVCVVEILIGLATLAGFVPVVAAAGGAALSLTLWLSATWPVRPYYLGANSIYLVAWLAYLLMLPSVRDALRSSPSRRGESAGGQDDAQTPHDGGGTASDSTDPRRRGVVVGGAIVVVGGAIVVGAVAAAGLAGLVGRSRSEGARASGAGSTGGDANSSAGGTGAGTVLASVADLERDGSVVFDDPQVGSSVLVALGGGEVAAFSRRCTHSGCTSDFDEATQLIRCPCHASTFDPADGARVLSGPAPRPLPAVPVVVDESTGEIRRA